MRHCLVFLNIANIATVLLIPHPTTKIDFNDHAELSLRRIVCARSIRDLAILIVLEYPWGSPAVRRQLNPSKVPSH